MPLTELTDATFVQRAFARGLQPPQPCPRCNVPMDRDLEATQYPVWVCAQCVTRWTGVR